MQSAVRKISGILAFCEVFTLTSAAARCPGGPLC